MAAKFPLFKGATRVPTFLLIPRNMFIVILMGSACLFMVIKFYAIGVFALLWVITWAVTKYDDRMFRILWLWLITKVKNSFDSRFTNALGGSTYAPVEYTDPVLRNVQDER
ncbi:type IV secretion system protein VirB3 [Burkholderia sp. TSV86]|nr:type IV secretion system protein VirB3 [Burkholderia sp. TSV86]